MPYSKHLAVKNTNLSKELNGRLPIIFIAMCLVGLLCLCLYLQMSSSVSIPTMLIKMKSLIQATNRSEFITSEKVKLTNSYIGTAKTDTGTLVTKFPVKQDIAAEISRTPVKPLTAMSDNVFTYGSAIRIDRKRYVCSVYRLNFGNLMFIHASNYGVAFDNNLTLAVSPNDYIYETFLVPKPVRARINACRGYKKVFSEYKSRYFTKFDIPKKGNIRLNGYLQSWKYFRNSFEDIRKQFTFKPKWSNQALDKIQQLVREMYPDLDVKSVTTVGIHVRRGNYLTEKRPVVDRAYIESAKKHFLQKYSNVLFIVATNPDSEAKKWCTENIINGTGKSVFSGFNHRFVDMAILTKCDHMIISTGTYSWWAGFLNKGTVIHYDWIPPNHYKFNRDDYILDSWIGINSTIKYKTNQI